MQPDLFTPAKGSPLPVWTVKIRGKSVPFTLTRSGRARQVWLRIGLGTGLVVVAPARMPMRELTKALAEKADWIDKNLSQADSPGKVIKKPPVRDGLPLPYLGRDLTLRVVAGEGPGSSVAVSGGEIVVEARDKSASAVEETLKDWYKGMARRIIPERVTRLADGHKVGRVCIRDQRTRWGSCSPLGNLSFNWRLVMAPRRVIDYLIIHELTHLAHHNHSKRFWDKVARRCPRYMECEDWLKRHGRGLPL